MGEFSKLFRESRLGKWESSQILPKEYFATLCELLRDLKTLPREQNRRMRVFSGFEERVLALGEFAKLESSIGEWESSEHRRMGVFGKSIGIMGEFSKLFRESRICECESAQVLPKEYCHWASAQNSAEIQQKRRMGVFQGFHGRVLPFCDFSKLESSIGEWEYSERVLALWASSQNSSERAEEANGSFLRFWRKSIAILRLLKTGEQHSRKEYWHYGRVLKTLPREQIRQMGVFSDVAERVFCHVVGVIASSHNSAKRAE